MSTRAVLASAARRQVYLHIGAFKTGTSFLQSVLLRNRQELEADGVLYPTTNGRWSLQTDGIRDLLSRDVPGVPDRAWGELVDHVAERDLPLTVISVERTSTATAEQARALVRGFAPADVHVILTLRDLARVLPSDWQSKIKQGRTWSFSEYVAAAASAPDREKRATHIFWDHHDALTIANRWLEVVGRERFHIVTVPPSGSGIEVLWQRFATLIGLDPSRYSILVDAKNNYSLPYSDTDFLRRINLALGARLDNESRKRWATRYLANTLLRPDSQATDDRPRLGSAYEAWVVGKSIDIETGLRALDVHVSGDLSDLVSHARAEPGSQESEPQVTYPQRAVDIIAALVQRLAELDPPDSGQLDTRALARSARRRRRKRSRLDEGDATATTALDRELRPRRRRRRARQGDDQ